MSTEIRKTAFVPTCTCGLKEVHRVMEKITADGIHVYLYNDTTICGVMGIGIKGVPMTRPQSQETFDLTMKRARKFMDWVPCYDYAELGDLWKFAGKADRKTRPASKPAVEKSRPFPITWSVSHADRDGNATEWHGEIPALIGLRLCVFRSRKGYEVCAISQRPNPTSQVGSSAVAVPLGVSFTNRKGLDAYLYDAMEANRAR
jgi:hypothetical protein